ncbi:MAG TPA: Do family serine endopeptidase, partial [Burkholderiaceae bacterium]|nr:Do family serine endopeptidase [Burkholderiaceae bacterium]
MQITRFAKPALIAAAVSAAFAFGYQARMPGVTEAVAAAPVTSPSAAARTQLPDFAELVEANGKSVVNIAIVRSAAQVPAQLQGIPPEMLRRFGIPGMPGQGQPGPQARGVGSGFIISNDGLILTNAHVVEDAAELVVRLADKREFKGKVLGADKLTDVAVVKIDAKDLPALRLGSSDKLRVGEWVAAIGSPFGLESSVTAGIVSAKSRNLPDDRLVPFIQTDVAVNPGNSGGPLFNMAGEVVGINSQIFSTSGGYMGLSFAIPIDLAVKIKDQLVKDGKVSRGRLGVGIQGMDQALAETFGLKSPQGALVSKVEPGLAAAKAGLKEGDVILEFDGKPLKDSAELPALVAESRPGAEVKLKIWRDRAEKTLELKVGAAEAEAPTQMAAGEAPAPQGKLGVAVRPLQPQEAQRLGIEGGMVVQESGGAAAKAGIRQGDVIVSVNGKPVKSIEDLRKQV